MFSLAFLITLVIVLVILGAVVLIVDKAPIDANFKTIAKVIIVVGVIIWLLLQLRAAV